MNSTETLTVAGLAMIFTKELKEVTGKDLSGIKDRETRMFLSSQIVFIEHELRKPNKQDINFLDLLKWINLIFDRLPLPFRELSVSESQFDEAKQAYLGQKKRVVSENLSGLDINKLEAHFNLTAPLVKKDLMGWIRSTVIFELNQISEDSRWDSVQSSVWTSDLITRLRMLLIRITDTEYDNNPVQGYESLLELFENFKTESRNVPDELMRHIQRIPRHLEWNTLIRIETMKIMTEILHSKRPHQ